MISMHPGATIIILRGKCALSPRLNQAKEEDVLQAIAAIFRLTIKFTDVSVAFV